MKYGLTNYVATDLNDIADMFDRLSASQTIASNTPKMSERTKNWHRGQAAAYKDAGDIIRNTRIESQVKG